MKDLVEKQMKRLLKWHREGVFDKPSPPLLGMEAMSKPKWDNVEIVEVRNGGVEYFNNEVKK